jgi:superfamily II DNA or RNA helicase
MLIDITRYDGALALMPAPPYVLKYLQYSHRSIRPGQRKSVFEKRDLYVPSPEGGIVTLPGFFPVLTDLIEKNRDTFQVNDIRTPLPPPDLNEVKKLQFRDYQIGPFVDFILAGAQNNGILNATGGYGKTHLQMATYAAWHTLNTIVAIPYKEVFNKTLQEFREKFPHKNIGAFGGSHDKPGTDLTITTFRSLPKCSLEKCQLLLVDEVQAATGDYIQGLLTQMHPIRVFGFTATDEGMFNKADKLVVGLFGPRLVHIPYEEAEEAGAVVPCVVWFLPAPKVFLSGQEMDTTKIRKGIKTNKGRNELIARACSLIPSGWQSIVFVDTVNDHMASLFPMMPAKSAFFHRGDSEEEYGKLALKPAAQKKIIEMYQDMKIKHLVTSNALKAGFDSQNCRVVVMACGGSVKPSVLQKAYRGSRILSEEKRKKYDLPPKEHFVLLDFEDTSDPLLVGMTAARRKFYQEQGWTIRSVDSPEEIDWHWRPPQQKELL